MGKLIAFILLFGFAASAQAKTIIDDRGGYLLVYATEVYHLRLSGEPVQVIGDCYSACTLFLSLPPKQLCITRAATFNFHKPYGGNKADTDLSIRLMREDYPRWVVNWIDNNGGLTNELLTMDYSYAKRFIKSC